MIEAGLKTDRLKNRTNDWITKAAGSPVWINTTWISLAHYNRDRTRLAVRILASQDTAHYRQIREAKPLSWSETVRQNAIISPWLLPLFDTLILMQHQSCMSTPGRAQ